jgi:hypothetical protein
MLKFLKKHLPYVVGVALVVVNTLLANGDINLSNHSIDLVNGLLGALGLGVLHHRQA